MISCYRWRANLYKELSKPTTSIGLLRADISVNPTISLKHTVTQSNSSALTFDLCPYHSLTWPWTTCLYPLTNVLFPSTHASTARPWPRGSSWAVPRPPSATSDKAVYRHDASQQSAPSTWLEASVHISPSCWAYHRVSWHTRDSAPGMTASQWPVGYCRWSDCEFLSLQRHADPENDRFRALFTIAYIYYTKRPQKVEHKTRQRGNDTSPLNSVKLERHSIECIHPPRPLMSRKSVLNRRQVTSSHAECDGVSA